MKRRIKDLANKLIHPVRKMIRGELNRESLNIELELQKIALRSTAEYVAKHMAHLDSVDDTFKLLTLAVGKINPAKPGLILEFGVHGGGTINHIASHVSQTVHGFDSFEGLPERWRDNLGVGAFKMHGRLPQVRENVKLIKGWFNESLPGFAAENPGDVSFIHIDCDLYSSTATVFETLQDRIKPGCVIVFDEYFNYHGWQDGEYKAFQELIQRTGLQYEYLSYNRYNQEVAVIIK